jgi:hypothetical protein
MVCFERTIELFSNINPFRSTIRSSQTSIEILKDLSWLIIMIICLVAYIVIEILRLQNDPPLTETTVIPSYPITKDNIFSVWIFNLIYFANVSVAWNFEPDDVSDNQTMTDTELAIISSGFPVKYNHLVEGPDDTFDLKWIRIPVVYVSDPQDNTAVKLSRLQNTQSDLDVGGSGIIISSVDNPSYPPGIELYRTYFPATPLATVWTISRTIINNEITGNITTLIYITQTDEIDLRLTDTSLLFITTSMFNTNIRIYKSNTILTFLSSIGGTLSLLMTVIGIINIITWNIFKSYHMKHERHERHEIIEIKGAPRLT